MRRCATFAVRFFAAMSAVALILLAALVGCGGSDSIVGRLTLTQTEEQAYTQETQESSTTELGIEANELTNKTQNAEVESTQSTRSVVPKASIPRLYWPTKRGAPIACRFGDDWVERGCDGRLKRHAGTDIDVKAGSPVYAAETGRIIVIGFDHRWQGWVTIEHTDRKGNRYTTVYWHINPLGKWKVGDVVKRGEQIGTVAKMKSEKDEHLHFGVRNAPYSNVANRGALPRTRSCSPDNPQFPEHFEDPLRYTSP